MPFDEIYLRPDNVFGLPDFIRLNAWKADTVEPFSDGRFGIVFGVKEGMYMAPWSAPYTTFYAAHDNPDEEAFRSFCREVKSFLDNKSFRIVTPPVAYTPFSTIFAEELVSIDGMRSINDPNYILDLSTFTGIDKWARDARRNFRHSLRNPLRLVKETEPDAPYRLIAAHHAERGYNMAMCLDEVRQTARIVPVDFWTVRLGDEVLAAAYCYHVGEGVVQVINVGDTAVGRKYFAVTFLFRQLIEYYRRELFENGKFEHPQLDYGPATLGSEPNAGLIRYKESLCFVPSPKYVMTRKK